MQFFIQTKSVTTDLDIHQRTCILFWPILIASVCLWQMVKLTPNPSGCLYWQMLVARSFKQLLQLTTLIIISAKRSSTVFIILVDVQCQDDKWFCHVSRMADVIAHVAGAIAHIYVCFNCV